jgi:hypothetical protein
MTLNDTLDPFQGKITPIYVALILLCSMLISSCGSSEKTTKKTPKAPAKKTVKKTSSKETFIVLLNKDRSKLSDPFATQGNNIPKVFTKETDTRNIGNPNQGFRVQIISTRNVANADSTAKRFRFWADSMITPHAPKVYVLFRQPYYKVQVGNFQFQKRALKLEKLLKSRYPGAWVVHDKINPNSVPSDTVSFKIGDGNKQE